jgi:hypothetical protein
VQAVLQGDVGLLDLPGLEPDRTRDPVDGSRSSMIAPLTREVARVSNLMPRSRSYSSIASIRPKMPYDARSACSMFGGRPTDPRPATYLTSGA